MRTLDIETPADILRIQLVSDIAQTLSMSERLALVKKYDEAQQVKLVDVLKEIAECKKGKYTASYMRDIASKAL